MEKKYVPATLSIKQGTLTEVSNTTTSNVQTEDQIYFSKSSTPSPKRVERINKKGAGTDKTETDRTLFALKYLTEHFFVLFIQNWHKTLFSTNWSNLCLEICTICKPINLCHNIPNLTYSMYMCGLRLEYTTYKFFAGIFAAYSLEELILVAESQSQSADLSWQIP